jgi:hypothetical protein
VSLDLASRRSVVCSGESENDEERAQRDGVVVIVGDDEDEDGDDHGERQEVHTDRVRQGVVHDIDVLRKAVRDAAEWSSVEEGHRGSEDAMNGAVQHYLTCPGTKYGDGY